MKQFFILFFPFAFLQVVLGAVSEENADGYIAPFNAETLLVPDEEENVTVTNFEVVKCLVEAINVNLKEKFSSETINLMTLPIYEKDIYRFYEEAGGAAGKWSEILKNTVNHWNIFGNLKCKVELLAFYGLARICEASGHNLDPTVIPKVKGDASGMNRTNKIFYQITKDKRQLNADEIYQTLLGFYGRFRYYGNPQELKAAKMKSIVEKRVKSDQSSSTSVKQPLGITDSMKTLDADDSSLFKYVQLLEEALKVNLDEKVSLPSLDSNSCPDFEMDIYAEHKNSVRKKRTWAFTFENCLKKWDLFGVHKYKAESLSFRSILRVLSASGYQLSLDLIANHPYSGTNMLNRLNRIIIEVCNNSSKTSKLSSQKVYQTLLWFYGTYKDVANEDELRDIKVECSAEKPLKQPTKKIKLRKPTKRRWVSNKDAKTKVTKENFSNTNVSVNSNSSACQSNQPSWLSEELQNNSDIEMDRNDLQNLSPSQPNPVCTNNNSAQPSERQTLVVSNLKSVIRPKFDLVKQLTEALSVDLEANLSSKVHSLVEQEIYPIYILEAKSDWSSIFKTMLEKWGMFGDIEIKAVPLAFFGLLKICYVSGFKVSEELTDEFKDNSNFMKRRVNGIIHQIHKDARHLEVVDIYQTLLLLFGNFRQSASRKQLEAVKKKCAAERQDNFDNDARTFTNPCLLTSNAAILTSHQIPTSESDTSFSTDGCLDEQTFSCTLEEFLGDSPNPHIPSPKFKKRKREEREVVRVTKLKTT